MSNANKVYKGLIKNLHTLAISLTATVEIAGAVSAEGILMVHHESWLIANGGPN